MPPFLAEARRKRKPEAGENANRAESEVALALGTSNPVKSALPNYVRSVRDILSGINKGNKQALGDWGFESD